MIEKPSLTESLNILKFEFENNITVELRNLSDSGKAEVWTRHNNKTLVDVSDLNLLAARSRNEHCQRIKTLTPGIDNFDWPEAFRYIVPLALQAKRKGEPVIELGQPGKEIVKPKWDAYPLVVSGMINILFGDRGSLKTKLALVLALVMMLPWDDNNLGIIAPPKPLSILKLDFEATQDADDYEWRRLLRGIDAEGAVQLKYRACRRPLADDVESIAQHADSVKADVLIIDSLGPASGGDLNASEPALRLNAALRQLNRTVVMTSHTAKNQLGIRSVFGNSFYENLARNIWEVTKEEDEDSESPQQHIALRQTKSPPFAPHHKPIAFEWNFDEAAERTIINKYDPAKMDVILKAKTAAQLILDILYAASKTSTPARTPGELTEETGEHEGTIRKALYTLKNRGKIIKLGINKNDPYGLPSNEER